MGSLQKDFPPPIWSPHWSPQQPFLGLKSLIYIGLNGGQTGIRTLETVSRLHTFQACAFDHSATCPYAGFSPTTG